MQAAETSMACGQRRMVGRSSSITDSSWSTAQAAQTITVNGRSVPRLMADAIVFRQTEMVFKGLAVAET